MFHVHSGDKTYLFPPEKHFFLVILFIPCVFTHTRQWGGRQTGKAVSWFQGWESKDVDHRDPAAQTINQLAFQTLQAFQKVFFSFCFFFFYSKAHESELPGVSWETQWRACVFHSKENSVRGLRSTVGADEGEGHRVRAGTRFIRGHGQMVRLLPFGQGSVSQGSKVLTLHGVKPQNIFASFSFCLLS